MKLVIKDVLIEQVAEELGHPIDTVEKVIAFQGKEMLQAVKDYNEVEVSGFGTFYVSQNKVKKQIANIERAIEKREAELILANEADRPKLETKLKFIKMSLETFKTKKRE